jgi:hypothetical protein
MFFVELAQFILRRSKQNNGAQSMPDQITHTESGATIFEGSAVEVFRLLAFASGLDLYAKTKIIPNRMWTPMRMLRIAEEATGKTYKRGQYAQAAADIRVAVKKLRETVPVVTK